MSKDFDENGNAASCRYNSHPIQEINRNWSNLNEHLGKKEKWFQEYVDRTMPIKSHFWILLGSLSILSAFAAVMRYIEKVGP